MAIIPQKQLFCWEDVDKLGDLERLVLVLDYLPDGELMRTLEKERGKGRDDYPIRAVWNSVLAGIVFQHVSIESLRRELLRNAQLRNLCGFDPFLGEAAVPEAYVYTRFLKSLMEKQEMIDNIFEKLRTEITNLLPDFGEVLAIDSKAINSRAKRPNKKSEPDGRRDIDADHGAKTYKGKKKDGTLWEKTSYWFGYKLHLIVDAVYELPVAMDVTKASASDITVGHKLIKDLAKESPGILKKCDYFTGDKAYDDQKLHENLWFEHDIKAVIDIRNNWKDGEVTRLLSGRKNIAYDYEGTVYCYCPETNRCREMAYGGFEKSRDSLKYRCPALQYGLECPGIKKCSCKGGVRIPLEENRRIFNPLARTTYKWQKYYNKRTSVERVNGRLDESFGFERHFIRGLKKMKLRCSLALIVMLAMAVGRIKQNQPEKMRSLVKAA